jgi:hypothetical protein
MISKPNYIRFDVADPLKLIYAPHQIPAPAIQEISNG